MDYPTTKAIKSWAEEDRPREKLMLKGKANLSNAELLAILIGSGSRNESAVELSKRILAQCDNNLHELSRYNLSDLCEFKGIGSAKAISIISAMELGKRYRSSEALSRKIISSSHDAFNAIYSHLSGIDYEEFFIIILNRANEILGIKRISEGGTSGTLVDPKKVFKLGLNLQASSIILCHNHPSGSIEPSPQDISITKKLVESGKMLELNVIDHLIIGNGKYYSFADEGVL